MLYSVLEKALNRILQSDSETLDRLAKLQGKIVKISFTDWSLDCFIFIEARGVHLTGQHPGPVAVDTTIRGKLAGLIRVGCSGASGAALFDQGIEVVGDAELGEKIRDILRQIDIDPEELLSHYIGDAAAHQVTWRAKRAFELGKQTWQELCENVREFCQIEAQYLPTRTQAENFYAQVAHLRDGVDRAAARLDRLAKKIQQK